MAVLFSAVLLSSLLMVSGHEWALGDCPQVQSQENFDTNRFLGQWYVIEQIDTNSECLQLKFERTSEAQLQVTKIRQHPVLKTVGIDHTNRYSAVLDLPNENEARMRVKWTLNPRKADYIVMDTDYISYALIFECQNLWPRIHRYSASIFSQSDSLGTETINKLKRELERNSIDTSDFSKINHNNCKTLHNPDVNIDLNRDTFKDIMATTRNGIQDLSTSIAESFRTIRTTVSDAVSSAVTRNPATETSQTSAREVTSAAPDSPVSTQSSTGSESSLNINIRNPKTDPDVSNSNDAINFDAPASNPDLFNGNPEENTVDGRPIFEDPADKSPAAKEEDGNVKPSEDVLRTVVTGL